MPSFIHSLMHEQINIIKIPSSLCCAEGLFARESGPQHPQRLGTSSAYTPEVRKLSELSAFGEEGGGGGRLIHGCQGCSP